MAKDFDDFDGLTEDEMVEIQSKLAEQMGLDQDGDHTSIPITAAPLYYAVLNQAMTMKTLRKYHEWSNA